MKLVLRFGRLTLLMALAVCSPRQLILQEAAGALATQGSATEDDLVLAREASAFYLKLTESVQVHHERRFPRAIHHDKARPRINDASKVNVSIFQM
ncbi:MAG: hypothetical protein PHH58_01850 [Rhodoferax sp.]|nr:hypothetical protein [Rhodoferax sp.]